ncbi:sensor histidine kinase [Natrononativus amylolyticus]|uniref:sensor histidine kinase n=1 Tax=Natrononativus amylolyticus TaxID=2963434 RepID=UPI0020CFB9FD|nr:ATP-binding protein [Natrononativus amylolyticus]
MNERAADRVGRLRETTAELNACESIQAVYDLAVAAAERLIEFDASILCTVDDGVFVPRAVNVQQLVPSDPLSVEDGIAGLTVQNDRSYVIDDLETEPDARATSGGYRSTLSIPLAGTGQSEPRGVFQCHATEPDAFSEADREFGQLLVAMLSSTLRRLRSEAALNEERDQFIALFENVPDPAVQYRITDGTHRIDAANSAFIRVFGYDVDRMADDALEDVLFSEPSDSERPELATTDDVSRRTDVEVVRETATGPRPFLLRNVPVATGDGTTRGYLIYTDLTALKQRERELERKNERLDQFAGIVAHDLRNPLNVANGYLELIRTEYPDEPETLAEVADAHERMERLIDDLLVLARNSDDGSPDTLRVPLETIARQAWQGVETTAATLDVSVDGRIEADPDRLRRLFENLFRNSLEHGSVSEGGPIDDHGRESESGSRSPLSIRVLAIADGFAVEDDGPGIPTEHRDDVFDSGYTVSNGSTGLGLAIVRQIADGHGWQVELTEETSGGARFEFTNVEATWTTATPTRRPRGGSQ